ncbi:MAG: FGGY-family carbohydrate kinase, partial [Candidatus Humimicrobiaceae bacterium]
MTISFNLTGGLLLKWYRDNFCYEEKIISEKENQNTYDLIIKKMYPKPVNIFILPHFVGSGTPYMDSNSKGAMLGLDLETDKPKLSRAILESNAYDLKFNLDKLEKSGINIEKIVAIGGGAKSPEWLKIKSDVLGIYKEVNLQNEAASGDIPSIITVSLDEKPGVQAIRNMAPDIMPEPGKQSRV